MPLQSCSACFHCLNVGNNNVYCILLLAAACNYRPHTSAIGAPEQNKNLLALTTALFLPVVQGAQELNFVKIVSGRLSYTLSN